MKLYVINHDYINYLKYFDKKVPNVNYQDKFKLFLGKVDINNDSEISYYIPLTSYKEKFESMDNRLDFIKIEDPIDNQIIGAIDINNMIPAPDFTVNEFNYDLLRYNPSFPSEADKHMYYEMSMNELRYLNDMQSKIIQNAKTVFSLCRNESEIYNGLRNRCCDFMLLQEKAFIFNNIISTELSDLMSSVSDNLIKSEDIDNDNFKQL